MDSNYYILIKKLYDQGVSFYTMFGASVAPAKIKALVGDYAILEIEHGDQEVDVHCHYTKIEVVGNAD